MLWEIGLLPSHQSPSPLPSFTPPPLCLSESISCCLFFSTIFALVRFFCLPYEHGERGIAREAGREREVEREQNCGKLEKLDGEICCVSTQLMKWKKAFAPKLFPAMHHSQFRNLICGAWVESVPWFGCVMRQGQFQSWSHAHTHTYIHPTYVAKEPSVPQSRRLSRKHKRNWQNGMTCRLNWRAPPLPSTLPLPVPHCRNNFAFLIKSADSSTGCLPRPYAHTPAGGEFTKVESGCSWRVIAFCARHVARCFIHNFIHSLIHTHTLKYSHTHSLVIHSFIHLSGVRASCRFRSVKDARAINQN